MEYILETQEVSQAQGVLKKPHKYTVTKSLKESKNESTGQCPNKQKGSTTTYEN